MSSDHKAGAAALGAAYLSIYLIWGSTYLAIRFAIETVPPFLMAAVRFLVAGALLYLWARARGAERPTRSHWRSATIVGGLLLLGGNGGVVWAEQFVPSGIAALLVATVSLWIVLIDWGFGNRVRPTPTLVAGVVVGLVGVGLLVVDDGFGYGTTEGWVGAAVVVGAAAAWAGGSICSRHADLPASPYLATAIEMLAGGALLGVVSLVAGEWGDFELSQVSARSLVSLAYLIVFGALVAFTAYVWLLRVQPAARVATYAYVNPIVALALGWAFASEPVSSRTLIAGAVILFAVGLIVRETAPRRAPMRVGVGADPP